MSSAARTSRAGKASCDDAAPARSRKNFGSIPTTLLAIVQSKTFRQGVLDYANGTANFDDPTHSDWGYDRGRQAAAYALAKGTSAAPGSVPGPNAATTWVRICVAMTNEDAWL